MSDAAGPGAGDIRPAAAGGIVCTSAAFAELSAELLGAGKSLRFRALGASMRPLVRDGDVLLVRPADVTSVHIGDVVLCNSEPGRVVVHRVVRRQAGPGGYRFTVQGDQVLRPDGVVPAAQVYGKLAAIQRAAVQIDMDGPVMRLLGWCAVLRSCSNVGRALPSWLSRGFIRRLPVLSRYLA